MTLNELREITKKLAVDVDILRARAEDIRDDVMFTDEDSDSLDDARYQAEDAAALLEQAFDLLEECKESIHFHIEVVS